MPEQLPTTTPAPLPWTLDMPAAGVLRVIDAHGVPLYRGPDTDEVLSRVEDLTDHRAVRPPLLHSAMTD